MTLPTASSRCDFFRRPLLGILHRLKRAVHRQSAIAVPISAQVSLGGLAERARQPFVPALITLLLLVVVTSGAAQSPRGMILPQESAIKGPRDMQTANRQLEAAAEQHRQALQEVADPLRTWINTWRAYVELRAAHENINYFNDGARVKNPLVPLVNPKFEEARRLTLHARDIAREVVEGRREADASYRSGVTQDINAALRIIAVIQVTAF